MSNRRRVRLAERLLRFVLPARKAEALAGDLEEELDGSRARILYYSALHASAALWMQRRDFLPKARFTMTLKLAFRDALRGLGRTPGLSALALVVLATGMAAATVTFTVVDTVVLRPLPFERPDRLVSIAGWTSRNGAGPLVSPADVETWRAHVTSLASVAAWRLGSRRITGTEPVLEVWGASVTADLFSLLQAKPLLGRTLDEQDRVAGPPRSVVISHGLWLRRFGADPAVIGRTLPTAGSPLEIVGVMPQDFAFPLDFKDPIDFWIPYVPTAEELSLSAGRASFLQVVARLRDDATLEQARAEVEAVSAALARQHPLLYADWRPTVDGLHDSLTSRFRGWMLLALWAIVLLMAVACANVANLLLVRAQGRSRDIAVRASLGASRPQLMAVHLLESVLLACAATVCGLVLAQLGLRTVIASLPEGIARASGIVLDWRVFALTTVAALAAGLVAGIVPAWHSTHTDIVEALKDGGAATASPARRQWRSALLVTEIGFVVMLLVVSALLVGSFVRVTRADLGYEHERLVSFRAGIMLPGATTEQRAAAEEAFLGAVVERLQAVPGVASAALIAGAVPLESTRSTTRLTRPGSAEQVQAEIGSMSPSYLTTIGARMLAGRGFTDADRAGAERVVMIDEIAARALYGDALAAVGKKVVVPQNQEHTIVGVFANLRLNGPEGITGGQIYRPLAQSPGFVQRRIVVRTQGDPAAMVPALKEAVASVWPGRNPVPAPTLMRDRFKVLTADRRFAAGLLTGFGVLAILLGAVGVYSVSASMIAQQTREIGVRMALGATARQVRAGVLGGVSRHLAAGAVAGVIGGWAISRMFQALLFGVTTTSATPYLVAVAMVIVVGLVAALVPARRAARVDPLIALKSA